MSLLLIFVSSILGSPHCAAMCGGFVAVAAQGTRSKINQAMYHLGRLLTYVALGATAGFVGSTLNKTGEQIGITRAASIFSGTLLIFSGVSAYSGRSLQLVPTFVLAPIARFRNGLAGRWKNPSALAFALGACSTLLPCGWLYTYVTVAAGSSSPLFGATVMLFFWMGTLPLLITIGSLSQIISTPLQKYIPTFTSVLIVAAGFFSLFGHLGLHSSLMPSHHHCEP